MYANRELESLYWTGIASYGYNSYNADRQIVFASIDREAHANYGGNNFSFYTEWGRTIRGTRLHLQPYAGLEYIQLHQNDFVESGANSIDLATAGTQADAFRSLLGSRVLANLPTKSGRTLTLEGRAAWRHEFLNENRILDASFAGQTGTNFAVAGCERRSGRRDCRDRPDVSPPHEPFGVRQLRRVDERKLHRPRRFRRPAIPVVKRSPIGDAPSAIRLSQNSSNSLRLVHNLLDNDNIY